MPFPRLWTHIRLSAEMIANPPDVLFVPSHVLPLVHPRRSMVTVHDLGYLHFPNSHPFFGRLYLDLSTRWNARSAETVIADSAVTRQDLIRFYHVDPIKIRVLHPALGEPFAGPLPTKPQIDQTKRQYGVGEEYVISVGTIHPRKNYVRLVQAFKAVAGPTQLVIVGKKGWLYRQLESAVEAWGLTGRVKTLNYVPSDDLRSLYAGACLCVFPSLYEGFGFPILEAQASGTPIICSNMSSLPEVAGEGALFFDPLDVGAMSAAITRVMSDDHLRTELIGKGRANLERFDWNRAAQELLGIAGAS